jgi:aryl-alcohol dehydrogenase
MKIKAAVVYEPRSQYIIDEIDLAAPKSHEVLVKIAACGICSTDDAAVRQEFESIPFPIVLGHEGSGTVVEIGEGVKSFKIGDRVCLSFSYCGECPTCSSGRPYGCEKNMELNFSGHAYDGTTRLSRDGKNIACFFDQSAFATYSVVHQNNLIHIPDGIDLALAAPLGCGIQTGAGTVLNYLKPGPGSSIVVSGCGAVGMSAIMAARLCGCSRIIGVDVVDSRLTLALELGATHVINAKKTDTVSAVMEITNGRGAEYAADCTGIGSCVRTSLNCTGFFGVCAVVGTTKDVTFSCSMELSAYHRTLTGIIEGHCTPKDFIPTLIEFYKEGRFPFDKLIRYYNFEDINTAAADALSGATLKPVIVMQDRC